MPHRDRDRDLGAFEAQPIARLFAHGFGDVMPLVNGCAQPNITQGNVRFCCPFRFLVWTRHRETVVRATTLNYPVITRAYGAGATASKSATCVIAPNAADSVGNTSELSARVA